MIQKNVIEQCTEWRKKIRDTYDNWPTGKYPITWLDPINGEVVEGLDNFGSNPRMPDNAIVDKDRMCVNNADIIIANLDSFGEDRPLIGTISEMVWAHEFHKPVITITDNPVFLNHPFTKNFTSWYVTSVDELLERKIVNQFYKAFNSAQY